MKALALLILLAPAPALAEDWSDAALPVYRGVETVADKVYGLVRGDLFSAMLPGRLSRRMSAVPAGTSETIFADKLRRRQEGAARQILEERPIGDNPGPEELQAWRRQAFSRQATAVSDALVDTLVRRYQLERFGQDSGAYASNIRNWDADFLASASILGSAYLYVAGLRTDWRMGPMRVDFDTKPGAAFRGALQGGDGRGLAALTLSRPGRPLALKTEWGLRSGRVAAERFGVTYSTRF